MAFKRCACGRVAVVEIDGAPRCTDCSGIGMKESEVRDLAAQVCGFLSASPDLPDGVAKDMFLKAARVCRLLNDMSGQMQALQQLCYAKGELLESHGCYDDALWSSLIHERDAALATAQARDEEAEVMRALLKRAWDDYRLNAPASAVFKDIGAALGYNRRAGNEPGPT